MSHKSIMDALTESEKKISENKGLDAPISLEEHKGFRIVTFYTEEGSKVSIETQFKVEKTTNHYTSSSSMEERKKAAKERRFEAKKMQKQGFKQKYIAKKLNVSQKTISNDLRYKE